MSDQDFLVLGAGELGMPVLRKLAGSGAGVTVLLRPSSIDTEDADKRRDRDELRSLGVELLPGDLAQSTVDELAAGFAAFDTVVGCTGFVGGPGTQLKLVRAALSAGVRRYVPWQFGVDYDVIGRGSAQPLFDEQLDVRDLLRAQDRTAWLIISTGMFTTFLFEPSFGVVDLPAGVVRALGDWDTAVTVTTAEDIGKLAAAILLARPPIENEVVYTAGDTVTYGRLADVVEAVLGRPVRREAWGVSRLAAELAADPDDTMKKYRAVFAAGRGVAWDVGQTFNGRRGIGVTDVEQWARQNLPAGADQ